MRQEDRDLTRNLIDKFLEIGKLAKIRQFYEGVEPADDGRIRSNFAVGGTYTGRLSSSQYFLDPSLNLQNIPKTQAKRDPLYEVREILGPTPGKMFCSTDFSSAERRLLAYLADESTAIEWTETGDEELGDTSYPYKKFGANFFDDVTSWRDVTGGKYAVSKMVVLSLDRGVGWKKLKDQVNKDSEIHGATISASQAKEACQLFHDLFPGYEEYFDKMEETIRSRGEIVNCMGRKLIFFDRMGTQSQVESVVRNAVSFQAQAVGDILNDRLKQIYQEMDPDELQILSQVHDEICYECEPRKWKEVGERVKEIMEQPIDLTGVIPETPHDSLTIPADVAVSMSSWGEVKERI